MNPIDDQLSRLFRAAAQARPVPATVPAFGLETRILAAWREAAHPVDAGLWDIKFRTRGLILAGLIMAVSFWPLLTSTSTASANPFADYLQLTDSTVSSDVAP